MNTYRITLGGAALSYLVQAPSSCLAVLAALQRHGQHTISARPVGAQGAP